jgi:hypothetical protein
MVGQPIKRTRVDRPAAKIAAESSLKRSESTIMIFFFQFSVPDISTDFKNELVGDPANQNV